MSTTCEPDRAYVELAEACDTAKVSLELATEKRGLELRVRMNNGGSTATRFDPENPGAAAAVLLRKVRKVA